MRQSPFLFSLSRMAWHWGAITTVVVLSLAVLASLTSVGLLGAKVANASEHHHGGHHHHEEPPSTPPSSHPPHHGDEDHGHSHNDFSYIFGAFLILLFIAALVLCFIWCGLELVNKP
jgi:hypothetical protein